jgi:hypothetical protein
VKIIGYLRSKEATVIQSLIDDAKKDYSPFTNNQAPMVALAKPDVSLTEKMTEIEILAKSGFLSIIGMSTFQIGKDRYEVSAPQQPTNHLMVRNPQK